MWQVKKYILKSECVIFFEKQVPVRFASGSPAIRFIPMKNRDARFCQV